MTTTIRLVWKQYRFELGAMLATGLLLVGGALIIAWRLSSTQPISECLLEWRNAAETSITCESSVNAWLAWRYDDVDRLISAFPFVAGIVLGSVVVSREIEHRTAQLSWSMSTSRIRWLSERVVALVVPLIVLLSALAVSGELLESAREPGIDPRLSLHGYAERGPPILARGLTAFGAALLVGSLVGRQLPALIIAGGIAVAVAYTAGLAFPFGVATEWVFGDAPQPPVAEITDRRVGPGWRLPDGRVLTLQEARQLAPDPADVDEADEWLIENFEPVDEILRGAKLGEIEVRETVLLGIVTLAGVALAYLVVDRRRPY